MSEQVLVGALWVFVGIAVFLGLLLLSRGLIRWIIGTDEIIALLKQQNELLEARSRNVSRPTISKSGVRSAPPHNR